MKVKRRVKETTQTKKTDRVNFFKTGKVPRIGKKVIVQGKTRNHYQSDKVSEDQSSKSNFF